MKNKQPNEKPLRIAHLVPGLRIGGAERIVLDLHRVFDPAEINSTVLYWTEASGMLAAAAYEPVQKRHLSLGKIVSLSSVKTLREYLKESGVSLLHTHLMDADLLGFFAARMLGIPQVISIHSYPFPFLKKHCLRYRFMSMFDTQIICVSNTVRNHVLTATGIKPEKVSVIYSGTDIERFSRQPGPSQRDDLRRTLGISPDAFVLGCVSRVVADKGHEFLLDAAPRILENIPSACFLIVGDGDRIAPLKDQCRRLGIEKRVVFTGPRLDIPEMLSIIDIFVYPSLHEAFSISILEAMAAGKTIICANYSSIPELLTNGKCGIIVPLGDAGAISDAVISLHHDPARRKTLAQTAMDKAQSFSLVKTALSLQDLYSSIIAQKKRSPADKNGTDRTSR